MLLIDLRSRTPDLIASKLARGFPTDDGLLEPQVDLVSMYMDQVHWDDVGADLAREHGIIVYPSIRSALTLTPPSATGHWPTARDWQDGELAVDGVLLIGEHGDYAANERDRRLYPRKPMFEQVCAVMAASGRSVPVFSDKHLSYNWTNAKWMYDRARELNIPFMAGSSVPLFWRDPWLEHELETPIEEAVAVGFSGLDIYGFHTLEVMQCMVEMVYMNGAIGSPILSSKTLEALGSTHR